MIQELKIQNFLSFKNQVELSFEATKDTTLENSHIIEVAPGVRLLRFMMVMGANASGKSNLLLALEFLRDFWFDRKLELDETTGVQPFLLDKITPGECTEMEIKFWHKGIKYWYLLKLDTEKVHEERLFFYRSVQPTRLFRRYLDEEGHSVITINSEEIKISKAALEELQLKCLRNMSFFAARQQVNISLPIIDDARDWMRGGILPLIEPSSSMFEYAKRRLHEDIDLRQYILDFVHQADFNITDVRSNEIRSNVNDELMQVILDSPSIPKEEKDRVRRERTISRLNIEFEHTVNNERGAEHYLMPDGLQSLGTKRTLGLETAIFEALHSNSLVVMDEFDASLHPDLLEFSIQKFLQEKSESQMLVTTHYDPLLATIDDLIRKDNVWFTEKNEDGSTSLYSLTEFKGLGKMSSMSIRNAYRHGQFGALPNI